MIFSVPGHIAMIKARIKTQTRRQDDRYSMGRVYCIQPGYGKKGLPGIGILITDKRGEYLFEHYDKGGAPAFLISAEDAKAEGGYTVMEFENLYIKIYGSWEYRWAYTFKYVEVKLDE